MFKVEFESRRKSKAESWGDFGDEHNQLVDKAFPTLEYQAKEPFTFCRYLNHLQPAEVAFGVKERKPKALNKTVSSTIELESYLMKSHIWNSSSVFHVSTDKESTAESIQAVQQDLVGTMQRLAERVEKFELDASQYRYRLPRCTRGLPRLLVPLLSAGSVTSQDTMLGAMLQTQGLEFEDLGIMEDRTYKALQAPPMKSWRTLDLCRTVCSRYVRLMLFCDEESVWYPSVIFSGHRSMGITY